MLMGARAAPRRAAPDRRPAPRSGATRQAGRPFPRRPPRPRRSRSRSRSRLPCPSPARRGATTPRSRSPRTRGREGGAHDAPRRSSSSTRSRISRMRRRGGGPREVGTDRRSCALWVPRSEGVATVGRKSRRGEGCRSRGAGGRRSVLNDGAEENAGRTFVVMASSFCFEKQSGRRSEVVESVGRSRRSELRAVCQFQDLFPRVVVLQ